MNKIFIGYLSVSVSAALVTAVLLLFRPLYKERFSKRWQYYIWLVVVIRFLVPWNSGNGLVGGMFHKMQAGGWGTVQGQLANAGQEQGQEPSTGSRQPQVEQAGRVQAETALTEVGKEPVQKAAWAFASDLWAIWLLTALILFVRKITIYQCFVRYLKAGCKPVEDIRRLEVFGTVVARSRFTGAIGLYTNSMVASPLCVGFFHPAVVLTKAELPEADFYYTVLHEWTHYRRLDLLYKWLVQLTLCLHWFNPFVYLLEREASRMCELSCDEAVTKGLDAEGKRAYGDMLLRAVGMASGYTVFPASITLHQGKKLMKERLGALMKKRKETKRTVAISAVSALLVMAGAVAAGAYIQPAAAQEINRDAQLAGYKKQASKTTAEEVAKEDPLWDITKKNGSYYYKGRRVRIFMDLRADSSFARFHFDKDGKVDIKLSRAKDLSITGVQGLTSQEAEEIMEDYGYADTEDMGEKQKESDPRPQSQLSVSRLQKPELTEEVYEAVEDCKDGVWYVIHSHGVQYLYYNGVPGKYAFQPHLNQKKAVIKIAGLGGTGKSYVLLAVRGNMPLTVIYRGKAVRYRTVSV